MKTREVNIRRPSCRYRLGSTCTHRDRRDLACSWHNCGLRVAREFMLQVRYEAPAVEVGRRREMPVELL